MLQWQARSNPLAWWWGSLTLVSAANILVWFMLYREFYPTPASSLGGGSSIGLMLLLCAGYVFGCAFRSFLPRADVQRICLFDTWLSSVVVGRSVATVAEISKIFGPPNGMPSCSCGNSAARLYQKISWTSSGVPRKNQMKRPAKELASRSFDIRAMASTSPMTTPMAMATTVKPSVTYRPRKTVASVNH